MKIGPRIVKNFLSLSLAEVVSKVLSAALSIYVARYLGVEVFGQLAFATALTAYFTLFADFGLTTLGVREIAKNRGGTGYLAMNILVLQLGLVFLLLILLGFLLFFMPLSDNLKILTFLFGLSMLPGALSLSYIFQAHERMEITALVRVLTQLITVVFSFLLIYLWRDVLVLPLTQLLGGLVGAAFIFYLLKRYIALSLTGFDWERVKILFKQALPFVGSALAVTIYYNIDSVILQLIKGSEVVGYYNASYKIVLLLVGFAVYFQAAVYPTLVNLLKYNVEKAQYLLRALSKLLIFASLPVAIGGTVLAQRIIELVYGVNYGQSILPFQILIWSVFTIYVNVSFGVTLLAGGREKQYLKCVGTGAILNLLLNVLLIPKFSLIGAAVATIITEVYVLAAIYYYAHAVLNIPLFEDLYRALLAASLMGFFVAVLNLNTVFLIVLGAVLYLAILLTFNFVSKRDLQLVFEFVKMRSRND